MDPNIFGITGAALVLIAFLLNQTKKLSTDAFYYDLLNFIGSAVLLVYAVMITSYPFIVINIIWGGVSLKDVVKKLLKNKKIRFTL